MLTAEARARLKQKEAIRFEQKKRYNKAISAYRSAKVIWSRLKHSRSKLIFCSSRIKQCIFNAEKLGLPIEDEDE